MDAFLSFNSLRTTARCGDVPMKNILSSGISSVGEKKTVLVKIKSKILLLSLTIF